MNPEELITKRLDRGYFFNRYFVKTNEVEKELAETLKFAQKERISADYDKFYTASSEEAHSQF